MKGHLLASACALSLLIAAPAFAAGGNGMNNGAAPMGSNGMNGGSTMGTPGAPGSMNGEGAGMSHGNGMQSESANGGMAGAQPGMNHTNRYNAHTAQRHSYSGRSATSQESEVDRLNEESLRAAQQNRAFMPGGANGEQGGMNQPGGTNGEQGGMNQPGSPMGPGGGSAGGMQQPMQR